MDTDAHTASLKTPELGGALAGAIRVILSFTLLSRFAGLARETLIARILGDSGVGSAFSAAFLVPNLFRRLFGEGALSAAFLPEYTRLRQTDPDSADRLASLVIAVLSLVTGLITLLIEGVLLVSLWGGFTGGDSALSVRLTMVMLPMMPMVCVTAILGGMLQALGKFSAPAAAPIILNVFMIGGALTHLTWTGQTPETTAFWIGAGGVVASALQIAWSLGALRGRVNWTRGWMAVAAPARVVLHRFIPVAIGLGALQLSTALDSLIAMWPIWVGPTMFGFDCPLDEASNTILSTTSRFYQFPLGVFGLAVATAVFPLLARTSGDSNAFAEMLRRGVRISLFIGLPASAGLIFVAPDLTGVMLSGGTHRYSAEGIERAAAVLVAFAPAVWAYSLNNVLTRAFYARGDTRTPMLVSLICVALNAGLNFTFIWKFREAGLAWATAASGTIQCGMLLVLAQARLDVRAIDAATARGLLRILVGTLVMGGLLWWSALAMPRAESWSGHLARLAVLVLAGGVSFGFLALVLGMREARWILQKGPGGRVVLGE